MTKHIDSSPILRVGFVGAGHISPFHIQAVDRIHGTRLVGIHDLDRERAARLATEYGIEQVYDDAKSMFRDVDVVHVLTPPSDHAAVTLDALAHGCHVFVEKPMATSVAECDQMLAAAERYGRYVGVDHSLLLDPFTQQAMSVIRKGTIGKVHAVDFVRAQDCPPYLGGELPPHLRDGGFPIRDLGIHALYQAEAFLGEVRHAEWQMQHLGNDPSLRFDDWRVMLECQRGTASIHISYNTRPVQDLIIVQGTEGMITIDRFGMNVTVRKVRRMPEHPQRAVNACCSAVSTLVQVPLNLARVATKRIRRYHGLQAMVADFYERISRGKPPLVGPADARRMTDWIERMAVEADRRRLDEIQQMRRPLTADTLVTGATGLIGSALVRRLLDSGRTIRVLCRRPDPRYLTHPQVELVLGDLGQPDVVDRAVQGVSTIYHAGGVVHGESHEFWRANVEGTRNIVQSAVKHKISQLVYVSSLSVLQAIEKRPLPIDESWPIERNPERRGAYTQTKVEAERLVRQAIRQFGLPAVILRPGEVIGLGGPVLSSGIGKRVGRRVVIFGNGKLEVPAVHVEDLVDAMIASEDRMITDGTIIHLVDPEAKTQNELVGQYNRATGEQLKSVHIPKLCMYALGLGVQLGFAILRRSAPVSIYRLRSAFAPRRFDVSRAQQILNWMPSRGHFGALGKTVERAGSETQPECVVR